MNENKPCPFCGEPAEVDSQRGFTNYKGERGVAVAIYCSKCPCDMTLCLDDYPGYETEELVSILTTHWNKRTPMK